MMGAEFSSFKAFADHLRGVRQGMEAMEERALHEIGLEVQKTAREELGHYQPEVDGGDGFAPFPKWEQLKQATQDERVRQGYMPNDPLKRSGELGNSIGVHHPKPSKVEIGSPMIEALYLSHGTAKMAPRPFLGPAMVHNLARIPKTLILELAALFRRGN